MFTALMCACSASSHNEEEITKCVQILAESGADVNAKDRSVDLLYSVLLTGNWFNIYIS